MDEVKLEARRRKVALLILPTEEAIETLANQENKRHSPCDVLIDPRCVARASLTTLSMSAEPPETRISPRRHVTLDARGH